MNDTELLDALEHWLTEDPTRWQVVLRRLESDGTFICGLRPKMEKMPMFAGKNGFGLTLRECIQKAMQQ